MPECVPRKWQLLCTATAGFINSMTFIEKIITRRYFDKGKFHLLEKDLQSGIKHGDLKGAGKPVEIFHSETC